MTEPTRTNAPELGQYPHELDRLVVDTRHAKLVLDVLEVAAPSRVDAEEKAPADVEDKAPELGLTLLKLNDIGRVRQNLATQVQPENVPGDSTEWCDLDWVLYYLRSIYAYRYAGWTPMMGKNRIMTGVQFVTYPNAELPPPASFYSPQRANLDTVEGPINDAIKEDAIKEDADRRAGVRAGHRGAGVRAGILDTCLYEHSLLAGRYIAAKDSLIPRDPQRPVSDVEGHAAFLSSLVVTEAPAAELDVRHVRKVVSADHEAPVRTATVWDTACQMAQYADSGVQILNCSWVCYTRDGKPPLVLERAVSRLAPRVLIVAAAGNHGLGDSAFGGTEEDRVKYGIPPRNAPAYPAALPDVVAVGALDGDEFADFNPRGVGKDDVAPWIDVFGPGVNVKGAYFGDGQTQDVSVVQRDEDGKVVLGANGEVQYVQQPFDGAAEWSGTSFATATLTGAVAAHLQPHLSPREALNEVLKNDDRFDGPAKDLALEQDRDSA
jgi:membrane-anchored mycosin MYCP